jgi:hypothetical protein
MWRYGDMADVATLSDQPTLTATDQMGEITGARSPGQVARNEGPLRNSLDLH